MWLTIVGSVCIATVLMLLAVLIFTFAQKKNREKNKIKEESAFKGIEAGICERLHIACSDSKWRWVCYPAGFAANGGIARIEVLYPSGEQQFMDVCLATSGYMALHMPGVSELPTASADSIPVETVEEPISAAVTKTGSTPFDEESVGKWYNIVLKNALFALVDDLNAKNEVSLNIGQDGKAYVESGGSNTVVYEFVEMPDVSLWEHITNKLGEEGLFAEVRDGNCILISWECTEATD